MNRILTVLALILAVGGFFGWGTPQAPSKGPLRQPAREIDAKEAGVGRLAADFRFRTLDGIEESLFDLRGSAAIVIAVRDEGCPVSRRYGRRLARLESEYSSRGVRFLFVNPNPGDANAHAIADRQRFGFGGGYVADDGGRIAALLGATTTTDVFVLDSALTIVYRGAVDDQYGLGFSRREVTSSYVVDALESTLAGRNVARPATFAPGCYLALPAVSAADVAGTYHNRISRIIGGNCQTCHRLKGVAPFPLETFEQVRAYAGMIRFVVDQRIMPPWFADEGSGPWKNRRYLTDEERHDLLSWIDNGTPEGDPSLAPRPFKWKSEWQIGEPDAVLELTEQQQIPAEGFVDYRYVYVKTDFPEDRWIQKMEIRPTAPQATHHVLVFIEEPGRKRRPENGEARFQGGVQGYFASNVPGQGPIEYPPGLAKRLPAGAWLKFQLHYTPTGTPATDRTRIGFVFADDEPDVEVRTSSAFQFRFEIPPGAANHEVKAEYRFRQDATLLSFFPHMHVRGKAYRYELELPDGSRKVLLPISRYDFNWQLHYRLKEPLFVPAGSRLHATAWYDNSSDNPANPDPTRAVRWGDQTYDEMMLGYFDWHPAVQPPAGGP